MSLPSDAVVTNERLCRYRVGENVTIPPSHSGFGFFPDLPFGPDLIPSSLSLLRCKVPLGRFAGALMDGQILIWGSVWVFSEAARMLFRISLRKATMFWSQRKSQANHVLYNPEKLPKITKRDIMRSSSHHPCLDKCTSCQYATEHANLCFHTGIGPTKKYQHRNALLFASVALISFKNNHWFTRQK